MLDVVILQPSYHIPLVHGLSRGAPGAKQLARLQPRAVPVIRVCHLHLREVYPDQTP